MKYILIGLLFTGIVACKENETRYIDSEPVQGAPGVDGKDGLSLLVDIVAPDPNDGKDGDSYINTQTGEYFIKNQGVWVFRGNLTGPQGLRGFTGQQGAQGIQGLQGATGAKGDKGDPGPQGLAGRNGINGEDGSDGKDGSSCSVQSITNGARITCTDGTQASITNGSNGSDGSDGAAGQDGQDGQDAVVLSTVKVPANSCTQVARDIWVENIQNARVFDVYSNDKCRDSKGEYCDNVLASFGNSGLLDETDHPGSGTTCWANNIQIQGHKDQNNDILVKVLEYN